MREIEKSREIEREEREDPQNFELLKPDYKVSVNLNIFQVVSNVVSFQILKKKRNRKKAGKKEDAKLTAMPFITSSAE